MLDARKGQVYCGLYAAGARALCEDRVSDPLPWLRQLAELPGSDPITLLGPGAHLYRNEIQTVLGARAQLLPVERGEPRAGAVAELGARGLAEGAARPPEQVTLCYLRLADAEQKRLALHDPGKPIS
jgi:tRNA threonylcarbamoyladenosine biosynthesis protein TsaB